MTRHAILDLYGVQFVTIPRLPDHQHDCADNINSCPLRHSSNFIACAGHGIRTSQQAPTCMRDVELPIAPQLHTDCVC
jgi:hypothetical protein